MPAKTVLSDVCEVVRRGDIFHVDPDLIEVAEGWNPRTDFSGEDELVESIKARGVLRPLIVQKTERKTLQLVDGERRLRATLRARAEGAAIVSVPVTVTKRGAGEVELFLDAMVANGGKPLTPIEEAAACKRLLGWGLSVAEIAKNIGRSLSHVRNRLELAEGSPELKQAVQTGEIGVEQAREIVKETGGKVTEQSAALAKVKTRKKVRARVFTFAADTNLEEQAAFLGEFRARLSADDFKADALRAGFDPDRVRVSVYVYPAE